MDRGREPGKVRWGCLLLVIGALVILVLVSAIQGILGSGQQSGAGATVTPPPAAIETATPEPAPTDTPETLPTAPPTAAPSMQYMLATIQEGASPSPDDPLIGQFQRALLALKTVCLANGRQLSDMAVTTHDIMEKRGVQESYLSILQHVYASFPANYPDSSKDNCAAEFAMYATLRLDG